MTYTPRPNPAGDTLVDSRDQIRNNFQIASDRFAEDHVTFNGGANAGLHKWARFPEQDVADIPAAVADISTLYAKQGTFSNLFLQSEGGQEFQLTTLSALADTNITLFGTNTEYQAADGTYVTCRGGWTFLPGGLIMMYGRADNGVTKTIRFPFVFPGGAPYSVTATADRTTGALDARLGIADVSATSFKYQENTSSGNTNGINWVAIGK